MNSQTAQITPTEAAAMFVRDELACVGSPTVRQGLVALADARASDTTLRACSICDELKPAASFRQVIGRTTTEACGECCDRRDAADSSQQTAASRTDITREAIAEFCLRVAMKRYQRFQPAQTGGLSSCTRRVARLAARHFLPQDGPDKRAGMPALQTAPKEKSALARDPKEYAKWLQKLPNRIAAIVAKTYAEMGDEAFKLDSNGNPLGIPEDVAMVMIRDILNEGDDTLIPRNANKKLARRKS